MHERDRVRETWASVLSTCCKEPADSGKSKRCRPDLTQDHPLHASESPSRNTIPGFLSQAKSPCQCLQDIIGFDYALSNRWEAVLFRL